MDRYFNRELSWLDFNGRVLEEASSERHPLLERVRFLHISARNLDEFIVTRLAGLMRQARAEPATAGPDGRASRDVVLACHERIGSMRQRQQDVWSLLRRDLRADGIVVMEPGELTLRERAWASSYAVDTLLPLLAPVAVDPSHPFPFVPGGRPALALELERLADGRRLRTVVVLPAGTPRFVNLPDMFGRGAHLLLALEDVVVLAADRLFAGCAVRGGGLFRLLRDADLPFERDGADILRSVEQALRRRRRAGAVWAEMDARMPRNLARFVVEKAELGGTDALALGGLLAVEDLHEIADIDRPDLRYPPFRAAKPPRLRQKREDVFSVIKERDLLVHHPYESFDAVVDLLDAAARDPDVLSVKQMLYRTSDESPVIDALARAAEAGKSVTVVVELTARFDEEANLRWARDLTSAGAQVVFGIPERKTHAKLALVARREGGATVTYTHLGTGNYNPETARLYTDVSYLTADPAIGRDAGRIFNLVTGYCEPTDLESLVVSPGGLRQKLLAAIRNETAHALAGRPAAIWAKCNALVDAGIIEALYEASTAGVDIDLVVRGICCLRPGVPGLSERIRVRSLLGRFLEHSRIYAFGNGHALPHPRATVFLSSADLMPRNLDRRIEILLPVNEPAAHERLLSQILASNVRDTAGSWLLGPDGLSARAAQGDDDVPFDAQDFLMHGKGPAMRAAPGRERIADPASAPVPGRDPQRMHLRAV